MATAWALGRLLDQPHSRDALAELLKDTHARVREEAIKSLGRCQDVEVCGDLIAVLGKENKRNRHQIYDALRRITGLTLADTKGTWESWWIVAEKKLVAGKSLGLPTAKDKRIRGAVGRYDTSYYGIPVRSDRVLFVLDISQSMRFGGIMDDPNRLEIAKEELKAVVDRLTPDSRFSILSFSTGNAYMARKKLIPATARNRRMAKRWIDKLVAAGGTNTFSALRAAFDKFSEVDTVFFLSDGEPSRGGITEPEELIAWVRQRNLRRRLVINSIALVKWHDQLVGFDTRDQANAAARFMAELAEVTRGDFVRHD